jgi:aspartate-semialdehyde dehydrogenase
MAKLVTGIVGWRGMVGSVLMQRMREEHDFDLIEAVFFSTSSAGQPGPAWAGGTALQDGNDVQALKKMQVIISCQGGDYTKAILPKLRSAGWNGYWIDAASAARMQDDAVIILDPVNLGVIKAGLDRGIKNFIGSNCTVGLMMMSLAGLFRENLIEWISCMTYQAASGAGAANMRELVEQMGAIHKNAAPLLADPASAILDIDRSVIDTMRSAAFPTEQFGGLALAGSLIPWIDSDLGGGLSREEWKGGAECNKMLGKPQMGHGGAINVESLCIRVGSMRCHSQGLTIKLAADVPMDEIEQMLASAHPWTQVVPNTKADSVAQLSPQAVSGSLKTPVGRLRKLAMGPTYLSAFTVGDQLLWGAAEPLRRMVRLLVQG